MNVKGYDLNDKEGYEYHHEIFNMQIRYQYKWCSHLKEIDDKLDNSEEMWDEYNFYWIYHRISNELFWIVKDESKEFRNWSIDLIRSVINQINEKKEEIEGKKKRLERSQEG